MRVLAALVLAVSGNHLVNGAGKTVRLLGVNRSGLEYACVQGWGLSDGPVDAASIAAMKTWEINAVRVPLNEDCWLGINGVKRQYSGAAYRAFVKGYVGRLNAAGLVAILDLHWSAPGAQQATGQQQMPDKAHSPGFWSSVARTFKGNRAVIFDLYNEPHDVSWKCWRDGCGPWAGMQLLVDAVRSAGGTQPLMLGGLAWANDLSGWLRWRPHDPLHRLIASFHLYNFNTCASEACWDATVAPVAKVVPVVTGELGENDCADGFVNTYMPWADAAGISYLGWTWDTWNCNSGPALITSYDGTPTAFGAGFRAHLLSLRNG
jgi:endoglucanase